MALVARFWPRNTWLHPRYPITATTAAAMAILGQCRFKRASMRARGSRGGSEPWEALGPLGAGEDSKESPPWELLPGEGLVSILFGVMGSPGGFEVTFGRSLQEPARVSASENKQASGQLPFRDELGEDEKRVSSPKMLVEKVSASHIARLESARRRTSSVGEAATFADSAPFVPTKQVRTPRPRLK